MLYGLQPFSPIRNRQPAYPRSSVRNRLQQLQSTMNWLFEGRNEDDWQGRGVAAAYPAVNMWEDGESVYVEAELPGLEQEDLEIHVTGGKQLTVKGERIETAPEKGIWHRRERGFGSFVRVVTLPREVDRDKVDARLENGILLVRLAKQESSKPRKIVVKGQ